ncbi:hypothetical protein C0J52_20455 [Blattella germanica]|nr:hypothetical protein C0J52_20455 [Blattella germanica]
MLRCWCGVLLLVLGSSLCCYIFPAEMTDPCRDKKCPYGARCVASVDGRTASCECPTRCPAYGDHSGSRPVCGSDGVDYKDQCELRKAACAAGKEVSVRFHGKCEPEAAEVGTNVAAAEEQKKRLLLFNP